MLKIDKAEHINLKGEVLLPSSKSISHRYLMIKALTLDAFQIVNLSQCNDTLLLQKALQSNATLVDFEDAGTPMRFFLAYAALKNLKVTITGNEGLKRRPVKPLVDGLNQLGCRIEYAENEGYLPLRIIEGIDITKNKVVLDGTISSQFVSALLLIAPLMSNGLTIQLNGTLASKPYIDLTLDCMKQAGVNVFFEDSVLKVSSKKYVIINDKLVEADWSAAGFIYALVAASKNTDIFLPGLNLDSPQGDRVSAYLFEFLGVMSKVESNGMRLSNSNMAVPRIKIDFTAIPDMFPALVVTCALLKINATFTGIKNLRLKESDRVLAMKENLEQTGTTLVIESEQQASLTYAESKEDIWHFKSFNDHRIAMACSAFALQNNITIDEESVVKKSYPEYWETIKKLGIIK